MRFPSRGDDEPPDPTGEEEREIAGEVADETQGFLGLMGHLYRGEVGRAVQWRQRLDRTSNWSVVLLATIITWTFSSPDNPHYVILGGVVIISMFLFIEARRYRIYDVYRARVRMLEENVMANALDPEGVVHEEWRAMLADDLRTPRNKIPFLEALRHRLRTFYLALLTAILASWYVRVVLFAAGEPLAEAARVAAIPGDQVAAGVAAFYGLVVILTFWPMERQAKGEIRAPDADVDEWRGGDDEDADAEE